MTNRRHTSTQVNKLKNAALIFSILIGVSAHVQATETCSELAQYEAVNGDPITSFGRASSCFTGYGIAPLLFMPQQDVIILVTP
jgi:hypothetical protein